MGASAVSSLVSVDQQPVLGNEVKRAMGIFERILRSVGYAFAGLLALLFIGVAVMPLPADLGFWTQEIRYRVTLEIDTPEGVKTGSSVIGVQRSDPPGVVNLGLVLRYFIAGGRLYPARFHGDAPFVDLGGGKNVIMLIGQGFDWHSAPFEFLGIWRRAHGDANGPGDPRYVQMIDDIWAGRILPTEKGEIAEPSERSLWMKSVGMLESAPVLITFKDIGDSASATVLYTLDPSSKVPDASDPKKKFEEVFGPGYAYKRATVEFLPSIAQVTTGIENRFPWWNAPIAWLVKNQSGYYVDRRAPESRFWVHRNLSTKDGFRRGSYGDRRYYRYDGNSDYGDRN